MTTQAKQTAKPVAKPFSVFAGIEDTKADRNRNYPTPGNYTLEVVSVNAVRSTFKKKNYLNVQAKVTQASGEGASQPGELVTISINIDQPKGLADARKLGEALGAKQGITFEEVDSDYMDSITAEDQPAAGTLFRVQVKEIMLTDKTGILPPKPFSTYKFSPAE